MSCPFVIRTMQEKDIQTLPADFLAQGWHKPKSQYERYFREQESGARLVAVAEVAGRAAGYACLLPRAAHGPFARENLPEIQDFNVLKKHQRQGIGGAILAFLEQTAAKTADTVTLAVGLHSGYGSAQRMYVKRGYLPDGSGLWYQDKPLAPYAPCVNDDDLVLYFSKKL